MLELLDLSVAGQLVRASEYAPCRYTTDRAKISLASLARITGTPADGPRNSVGCGHSIARFATAATTTDY